jgi:hypothetical protein
MSNVTISKPNFYSYWRPWNEKSNYYDSYLDYVKDVSLVKYGAETVGKYINQASKEQVTAINQLGQAVGRGMNVLSNQMSEVNNSLGFLNRNLDIQLEQQKLSNLLLQNISELLRVPDSEKERQHSIELGIKFFVNAKNDVDLYADALEELLKAESLMKQDYFVLHRIGCIYLHVEKFLNPEKAFDYFTRAGKYASIESDPEAIRLVNLLSSDELNLNDIKNLAADSYEKAAFSAYILGQFENALKYQEKAFNLIPTPQNQFLLSKYQARCGFIDNAVQNLSIAIDAMPEFVNALFLEFDLANVPEVIQLVHEKNNNVNNDILKLLERWKSVESTHATEVIKILNNLINTSFENKVSNYIKYQNEASSIDNNIVEYYTKIDRLINQISNMLFLTFDENKTAELIKELHLAKNLPFEDLLLVYKKVSNQIEDDRVKIGSKYAGGIVFYINETGNQGLVCAELDFGQAVWGGNGKIGANGNGIADGSGMENTKKIVELASWIVEEGFFSSTKKPAKTAARMCLESTHNGFNDWYLPNIKELELIANNLYLNTNIGNFEPEHYWSSNSEDWALEGVPKDAWTLQFNSIEMLKILYKRDYIESNTLFRNWKHNVRAVRIFNKK